MPQTDVAIAHVQVTDDPDEIFARLLADGAVIIEGFLSPAQVARLNEEISPADAEADPLMRNVYDFGTRDAELERLMEGLPTSGEAAADTEERRSIRSGNTRNVTGIATKVPSFVPEVLLHPMYKELCDRLLLPHCYDYVLNHSHMINVGPGANAQPIHRDEGIWAHFPGLGVGSHLQFASIVALVDFSEENGATNVVPGSHLWEGDPHVLSGRVPEPGEIAYAEMPAGSAVIYLGWTIHGAGRNRTMDTWRRGLHVSFCQGWLRTEENNTLATPPDVARNLPVRAQELLGYGAQNGLGMLELRNPIDQLRDGNL
jgi:ectoine hydroxylase-related dioxygenase (phytanoyl-CoA dioxygenase family)